MNFDSIEHLKYPLMKRFFKKNYLDFTVGKIITRYYIIESWGDPINPYINTGGVRQRENVMIKRCCGQHARPHGSNPDECG